METAVHLRGENFSLIDRWREGAPGVPDSYFSFTRPPGFELPRRTWVMLNRIRTKHGRCNASLFKWGFKDSPQCDCGVADQTVDHIVFECERRAYLGGANDFALATPQAVQYILNLDVHL